MQLAIAPDVKNLIVYNAPDDETGQTGLDEYIAIANADQAESVSSSWAVCEDDVTSGFVQAENTIFEQMALQGQSMFGAAGDSGAFSCLRTDGTTIINVLDPPSQPWVTSVGGTSLETANPGENADPGYPSGVESVWNTDTLCSNAAPSAANNNLGGLFWCAADRRRGRWLQPVVGPAVLPARTGREQPVHYHRQWHHPVRAGHNRDAVPRGSGRVG